MTLYADMLFLINFIMDSFILWIVSKITRKKIKALWLLLGGLVMAVMYCLLVVTDFFRFMNPFPASVLILAIGTTIALRPSSFKPFCKILLTAYIVSFTIGGLGMVLFYLTDLPYAVYFLVSDPGAVMNGLSWKLPALCIGLCYVVIKLGLRVFERLALKRQVLCPVRVFFGERDVKLDALVDTGHSLREPISQCPVIVAEFERIKAFLPDSMKVLFYEKQENDLSGLLDIQGTSFYGRLRMIPFTSLGRANGMMIGFKPDRVSVGEQPATMREDVVIGIYNHQLTHDGRYQALLGPELTVGAV